MPRLPSLYKNGALYIERQSRIWKATHTVLRVYMESYPYIYGKLPIRYAERRFLELPLLRQAIATYQLPANELVASEMCGTSGSGGGGGANSFPAS